MSLRSTIVRTAVMIHHHQVGQILVFGAFRCYSISNVLRSGRTGALSSDWRIFLLFLNVLKAFPFEVLGISLALDTLFSALITVWLPVNQTQCRAKNLFLVALQTLCLASHTSGPAFPLFWFCVRSFSNVAGSRLDG